ncbi:MAG: hypothetical protein IJ546_07850 [Prevotella sp.]|nr:hypothetical protein [Prevotella sp.]
METVRIYHSTWRMLLLALASLAFAVAGFLMAIHSTKGFHIVVGWIGVVFFGLGGLYMLYATLKERLTGKPFLTITDEAVIMEGIKQAVILFADVESFNVVKMGRQEFVAVHYKPDVERQKLDEANTFGRSIRWLNLRLVNAQENISTTGTGMKAQELCDLLNERTLPKRTSPFT